MISIDSQLNWDRERGFASIRLQSSEPSPALATVAKLRAFSFLLCMDDKLANALVEITLVRARVVTDPSHLNQSHLPWLISRLRSYFYAECAEGQTPISLRHPLPRSAWREHNDLLAGLAILAVEQREALVLIEAARLSYKEAARICRRPPLSFRKFVEQARTNLARVLSPDGPEMLADEVAHKVLDGLVLEKTEH